MSAPLRLRALWCLRVRPLLRRALGVPALDHATTFDARLSALEAAFAMRGQRIADIEARVARLVKRDVIDTADLSAALREACDALDAQHPTVAGTICGGASWSVTHGGLLAMLDRAIAIRRERAEGGES